MKIAGFVVCFIILTSSVFGQQSGSNQSTSLCEGRWEFFMSSIAIRLTFKIDKFTGEVYQLAQRTDKTLTWELIKKQESDKDVQKQDAINYQLFSSGQGIRYTYLLNSNSGLAWQLTTGENNVFFFQVVE